VADLVPHRRIHVVGAGGAGMSGLAKILAQAGHVVTASDLKPAAALAALDAVGVTTWVGHRPGEAANWDLVVASSAVPARDPELTAARNAGVEMWERPRLLEAFTAQLPTLAVTGTHGKTTGTAMLITLYRSLGRDPSFMVGGEMVDLNTNAHLGAEPLFLLEADEAFGTFSRLSLQGLAVTNVEADHLDHYRTVGALEEAFAAVAGAVDGPVVACLDDPGSGRIAANVPGVVGYGEARDATWRISDLAHQPGAVAFTLSGPGGSAPVRVPKPGAHIARNAAGVLALAGELGVDLMAAAEALSRFAGVRRRYEIRGRLAGITIIDDYAHHPTEVAATIAAASQGDGGRIVAAFQPHRFSRTAELGSALGEALAGAARVFVTDVYAAGEAPIPGVTGRVVADAAAGAGAEVTFIPRRSDLAPAIAAESGPGDTVLLLGAGDVTLVADELAPLLAQRR
jgi:UDP-N-acetylmuramate--alanine ligase